MKIKLVTATHFADYAEHLKSLSDEDRRTRFGYAASTTAIDALILNMLYNQTEHRLFAGFDAEDNIVGFGHLARDGEDWELAVSVAAQCQGRGYAGELIEHMIAWGKINNVHSVFMHCITENKKIQHLARKFGLKTVERSGNEITAEVALPEPTAMDYTVELWREQQSLVADIVKLQRRLIRSLTGRLSNEA